MSPSGPAERPGPSEEAPPVPGDRAPSFGERLPTELRRVRRWAASRGAPWLGVLGAVVVYASFLGYVTSLKFQDFLTYAYDLGNYNQVFWTTAEDHQFFFTTAAAPKGVSGWIVLGHFSPFLVLLVPIYALAPGPATLLYLQAGALASGALPTFGLAKAKLGSERWGLFFAGVYLATPLTFWPAWYDFHPEVFFVAPLLAAFYFLEVRRPWPFVAFLVLALMPIETEAPFILVFFVLSLLPAVWNRLRHRPPLPREKLILLGTLVTAGYLIFSYEVAVHASVAAITFGATYNFWPQLGASTPYQVFPLALLHPSAAVAALQYGEQSKAMYVLLSLAALAFFPLLGDLRYTVPGYLWLGLSVLSANSLYYVIGTEYTCYILPFFIAGAVTAVYRLRGWSVALGQRRVVAEVLEGSPRRRALARRASRGAIVGVLVVGLVAVNAVASPLSSNPPDLYSFTPPGIPSYTTHDAWIDRVMAMVPPHAGVLTDSNIFPLVSDRPNVWVVPWQTTLTKGLTFADLLDNAINRSSYIAIDWRDDFLSAALVLQDGNLTGWGLLAAADGVDLYERGYTGGLQLWAPTVGTYAGGDATPGNAVVDPQNASSWGPSLYHAPGLSNGTLLWSALGLHNLPPGNYTLRTWLAVGSSSAGAEVTIAATDSAFRIDDSLRSNASNVVKYNYYIGPTASPRTLQSSVVSLPAAPGFVEGNVTFSFSWNGFGYLNMLGWADSPDASVRLYAVSLQQVNA